jgi:hypothetical protein
MSGDFCNVKQIRKMQNLEVNPLQKHCYAIPYHNGTFDNK